MFVSHLVRTLGTQLAKWWWWTWCMCAAISLVEIRGKLAACCPHVISVTLDKNNISGCAQPIYYNRLHSGWSTLMKVKRHELVKSLCCCMTFNWRDQRRDRAKCWKLLKKVNARMISLPPPPILKVIHRSHHSRCGEEILGSHTGAPTATQGLPLPHRGSHWVQSQRYPHCGGAEDQQGHHSKANIYQGHHTNMHEIYQKGTTARKIYQRQPHTNVYQTYQQGHHSHTNIYQPATQPHWPSCRASGTTQSKGTPQERPKK